MYLLFCLGICAMIYVCVMIVTMSKVIKQTNGAVKEMKKKLNEN